jgi:hypothetical protein
MFVVNGPAADATDTLQPWGLLHKPVLTIISSFFCSSINGAPVKWNCQGTKVLGEKHVPLSLCPPQILHGLTLDRTWASTVRGWWLTARAMQEPSLRLDFNVSITDNLNYLTTLRRKLTSITKKNLLNNLGTSHMSRHRRTDKISKRLKLFTTCDIYGSQRWLWSRAVELVHKM